MTTSNSRRKKSRQVRKPRSGNRSPFAFAFGYSEFAIAIPFAVGRHWRNLFGLESRDQMELIRRRPVLSSKLAISKFEISCQKKFGFSMNLIRLSVVEPRPPDSIYLPYVPYTITYGMTMPTFVPMTTTTSAALPRGGRPLF